MFFYKKIDKWNNFFFKILRFTICFFLFCYYFWNFLLNFVYLYLSKNSENFYVFLFYGLEILSKIFWKSWNIFLKSIDIWNPKFIIYSIVYYLFFFFQHFWHFFFLFHLIKLVKIFKTFFVELYYTDYRFYQIILENYAKFLNIDLEK